jgi:hypothetical protein
VRLTDEQYSALQKLARERHCRCRPWRGRGCSTASITSAPRADRRYLLASIEKRKRNGELHWYARYRDPGDAQLVKVFDHKHDAERFLATVEASKINGSSSGKAPNVIDARLASM